MKLPLDSFQSIRQSSDLSVHARSFLGREVTDYTIIPPTGKGGDGCIYRFASDPSEGGVVSQFIRSLFSPPQAPRRPRSCLEKLHDFLSSDAAPHAVGLVIGMWCANWGDDTESAPVIEFLIKHRDRLPELRGIFIGDIVSEENEISWIEQTDLTPLLDAFPQMEFLRVRGSNNLAFRNPRHANLRGLTIETGGLPIDVIRSVFDSGFPELEHLELWLGTREYGGNCAVEDLEPLLSGRLFPKLTYLGLRNSEIADEVANTLVESPILTRIGVLDLSLGNLTDRGARALLAIRSGTTLREVRINHHYASEEMVKQLEALPVAVDTSERLNASEEERFIAISE